MPEQQEGLMEGFQLWLNLPGRRKMSEPAYQDLPGEAIPQALWRDATGDVAPVGLLRVIAGQHARHRRCGEARGHRAGVRRPALGP